MLKKAYRLKKETDFQRIFKHSKALYTNNFAFRVASRTNQGSKSGQVEEMGQNLFLPRFGFVISRKVEKRAVRRNALRRFLHSVLRQHLSEFRTGTDVIVIIKQNFSYPYTHEAIKQQFEDGLRRAGIIR